MNHRTDGGSPQPDWKAVEGELLNRVKDVARRIVERVRRVTEDTAPGPTLRADDPTGDSPSLG